MTGGARETGKHMTFKIFMIKDKDGRRKIKKKLHFLSAFLSQHPGDHVGPPLEEEPLSSECLPGTKDGAPRLGIFDLSIHYI